MFISGQAACGLEFRDQGDAGHHQNQAGNSTDTQGMRCDAKPAEAVDQQRHKEIGGDRQAGESTGTYTVDKHETSDNGACTGEATQWGSPGHRR